VPNALPIGREIPNQKLDCFIHCAAPNFRDEASVNNMYEFNEMCRDYITAKKISRVVIVGSWWQFAQGECNSISYTVMKNRQQDLFPEAVHVAPFSIYGNEMRAGRGFVPQLVNAIREGTALTGLSTQNRDFIHVSDVAQAVLKVAPAGNHIGNILLTAKKTPELP
jgi:hypothetical protein